jgi:hypothetical protein
MRMGFNRIVGLSALVTGFLLAPAFSCGSPSAAPLSGAEAERSIAWSTVGKGDPIPALMPTATSANALEAGFSPEWVERSVRPFADGEESARSMLSIMSEQRASDDAWAQSVEHYLREFIQSQIDVQAPTVSRVFCNAVGCLCYLERTDSALTHLMIYGALTSPAANEFGTKQMKITTLRHGSRFRTSWELTILMRPHNGSPLSGQAPRPSREQVPTQRDP